MRRAVRDPSRRAALRTEPRAELRAELRAERRTERRAERRAEPRAERRAEPRVTFRAAAAVLTGLMALAMGGCASTKELPELPPSMVPIPDAADVESVLYFIGDPGKTLRSSHPILLAMRRDIDQWAERLPGDSSVVVVVLGDMVYPNGLHDRDDPRFPLDSTHVAAQVDLVGGSAARSSAWEVFVAGNHDWGLREDWEGLDRLNNLEALLAGFRQAGYPVSLEPPPGEGGPVVVDLGEHLRLLLLDTAWWLMAAEDEEREALVRGLLDATATAGDRHIVIASHHPYQSAGSHGGHFTMWKGFGVTAALARAGAILQDLNSGPYRELKAGIREAGSRHRPALAHVGGHDHSLQVVRDPTVTAGSPRYSVVVGSASKLTDVGHVEGMLMRRAWPGYGRMFILEDGGVILTIEGAPPEYLACDQPEPARRECMERGAAAYRTLWSDRLR